LIYFKPSMKLPPLEQSPGSSISQGEDEMGDITWSC